MLHVYRDDITTSVTLSDTITLMSGVQSRVSDKSLVDSLEGTVVWEYDLMACPQTIVQLYRGLMKVYVNQSGVYEGATEVVEHQDKDQAVGLEMAEHSFYAVIRPSRPTSRALPCSYMRTTEWKLPKAILPTRKVTWT
jgi:hypothetical protein